MFARPTAELRIVATLTALSFAGCTSYETVLAEFDSASTSAARQAQTQRAENPFALFESIGAAANQDNVGVTGGGVSDFSDFEADAEA